MGVCASVPLTVIDFYCALLALLWSLFLLIRSNSIDFDAFHLLLLILSHLLVILSLLFVFCF